MTTVEHDALLALAGLLVLLGGVLPLLRRTVSRAAVASETASFRGELARDARSGEIQTRPEPALSSLSTSGNVLAIEAETVRALVTSDPARTAQVIKEWIARDRSNIKHAT